MMALLSMAGGRLPMRVYLTAAAVLTSFVLATPSQAMVTTLTDGPDGAINLVHAGDAFDIVGDCFDMAQSSGEVRVVLALADKPSAANIGYREVLATEEDIGDQSLRVQVPAMPEMANHTFHVRVYALGRAKPSVCDAGQVKVG